MSFRYVEFIDASGKRVSVNPKLVSGIYETGTESCQLVLAGGKEVNLKIPFAEIFDMLTGDSPTPLQVEMAKKVKLVHGKGPNGEPLDFHGNPI